MANVAIAASVADTVLGMTRLPAPTKMTSRPPSPLSMPPLACMSNTIAMISTINCVVASTVRGTQFWRSEIADRIAKTR